MNLWKQHVQQISLESCGKGLNNFYYVFEWKDLPQTIQNAWITLGWNQNSWDNTTNYPPSATKPYDDLTTTERDAIRILGYSKYCWNQD